MTIPAGTITITVQAMIIIVLISLAVEVHSMAVDLQEDGILVPVIQGAVTIQVQALHLTNPLYSMKTLQEIRDLDVCKLLAEGIRWYNSTTQNNV